jgi:hypothetical protein
VHSISPYKSLMSAIYEVLMGTHNCAVCSEPVDLTVDRCDETGDPVHKRCYLARITAKNDTAIPVSELAMASNPSLSAIAS